MFCTGIFADNIAERMYTRDLSEWEYISYFVSWWYNMYFDYPLIVRICLIIILLSSISVTILIISIGLSKVNDYFYKRQYEVLKKRFYNVFCEILTEKSNLSFQDVQSKLRLNMQDIRKRKSKRYMFAMSSLLVRVKADYYSESEYNFNNARMAVMVLGVQDFLERMLMFGSTGQCRRALQVAQFLMLILPESILVRLLNSSNSILSKETRMYYLWLSDSNPFRFFEEDTYQYTWRAWDALEIHYFMTARHKAGKEIPSLTPVINNCDNLKLQASLIREIGYWGNKEDIDNVRQYIGSQKAGLCLAAIECFTVARVTDVEKSLMEIYQSQTERLKLYILRALVIFNTGKALDFFSKAWKDSKVLSIKLNVLIALYMYGEKGKKEIMHIKMHTTNEAELHLFDIVDNFEQIVKIYK